MYLSSYCGDVLVETYKNTKMRHQAIHSEKNHTETVIYMKKTLLRTKCNQSINKPHIIKNTNPNSVRRDRRNHSVFKLRSQENLYICLYGNEICNRNFNLQNVQNQKHFKDVHYSVLTPLTNTKALLMSVTIDHV